jgi:hypothetical protein
LRRGSNIRGSGYTGKGGNPVVQLDGIVERILTAPVLGLVQLVLDGTELLG